MTSLEIVGRSSSHFTRTVRIFAHELKVAHEFRPVMDLTALDSALYGDNPALKIPVLVAADGPWFGAENICRELVRRRTSAGRVVLRGDVADCCVANAEELTSQAMTTEVAIVMTKMIAGVALPPKLARSLVESLAWLDANLATALARLPAERTLSFLEVTLFSLVTHLPFREVMDVGPYPNLLAFADRFSEREGAKATPYRYDAP